MRYGLAIQTEPTVEPVTLNAVKAHLHVSITEDDELIMAYIKTARIYAEQYTRRAFVNTTFDMTMDRFADKIYIPRAPLSSVTHIKYYDTAGDQQTLDSTGYDVDTDSTPGCVTLAYNQTWPSIRCVRNAVEIRFVAGYGDTGDDVPAPIQTAIKFLVAHWYEVRVPELVNRSITDVPFTVNALLGPYRILEA